MVTSDQYIIWRVHCSFTLRVVGLDVVSTKTLEGLRLLLQVDTEEGDALIWKVWTSVLLVGLFIPSSFGGKLSIKPGKIPLLPFELLEFARVPRMIRVSRYSHGRARMPALLYW